MNKKFLSLLISCVTFIGVVNGQKPTDTIDIRNIKSDYLESLFMAKLNEHRLSLKKPALKTDTTLRKAAKVQAVYCYGVKKLTHEQVVPEKWNVDNRVILLGGFFGQVGENLIYTYIKRPFTNKGGGSKTVFTYTELAEDMFQSWKNSPGHYANMIQGEFLFSGMGFQYDSLTRQVYAAQVFGSKPFVPLKNGLDYTLKEYGIKPSNEQKCIYLPLVKHLPIILSNYLYLNNDSIMLFIGSLDRFSQLFADPKDGMAIDIVFKEQFKCGEPNNLHTSSIYDGYMLRPIFSPYLKMVNRLVTDKVYEGKIGILPKPMSERYDFQLNTIFFRDSNLCAYSYPVIIEEEPIQELEIKPHWCLVDGKIKTDTFEYLAEIYIPFERNQVTLAHQHSVKELLQEELSEWIDYIDSVQIYAYSSIEGEEEKNLALQNKRAEEISKFFKERKIPFSTFVKENWDAFFELVSINHFDFDTINKSKEEIRDYVNQHKDEPHYRTILDWQREGKVAIYMNLHINDSSSNPLLIMALEKAIDSRDAQQVNIISSRIVSNCLKNKEKPFVLANVDIPIQKDFLPALNNQVAAKLIMEEGLEEVGEDNSEFILYNEGYAFLDTIYPKFEDFKPLKFNYILAQLKKVLVDDEYSIKKFQSFEGEIEILSKDTLFNEDDIISMKYNYYLSGAMLYYKKYLYEDTYYCIDQLKPLLNLDNLSSREAYAIGKFFNIFNMHYETTALLEKYLKIYPEDEDLIYLYCNTGAIYNLNHDYNLTFYLTQIDKLIKMNKPRYCAWINENFQLLREAVIKPTFCQYCKLE